MRNFAIVNCCAYVVYTRYQALIYITIMENIRWYIQYVLGTR